jgi:hypothetical protein
LNGLGTKPGAGGLKLHEFSILEENQSFQKETWREEETAGTE